MSDRPEDRCALRIRELYGDDLLEPAGVVHVASAWRDPHGRLFSLRIGPATPRSETDAFVLEVARARADAIVTTGRILRDEPSLTNVLKDGDVAAWRRQRLRKPATPRTVVLSRGAPDPSHPLFATSDVVVRNEGPRDTLAWLRDEAAIRSVAIEAGPSTTRALYAEPVGVDEVMLSICGVEALPPGVQGGALPDLASLYRLFPRRSELTCREDSGTWSFLRLRS